MSARRRVPTTEDAIRVLSGNGLDFQSVIDVGVHRSTKKLIQSLPGARHILIEPSPAHAPEIAKAYAGIDHHLHQVAVGDEDLDGFLADISIGDREDVTHSQIVGSREEAEALDGLRGIHELPIRRLDTLLKDTDLPGHTLLKIDVDGHEIPVLQGARETLGRVAAITIEAPRTRLMERARYLEEAGFTLYDIVDIEYYSDTLYQVDLVFVRADLLQTIPTLDPFSGGTAFQPDRYESFKVRPRLFSRQGLVRRTLRKLKRGA